MMASKIKKKLLVGMLCASMLFQNTSIGVLASEDGIIETETTDAETQETEVEEIKTTESEEQQKESSEVETSTNQMTEGENVGTEEIAETETEICESEISENETSESETSETEVTENETLETEICESETAETETETVQEETTEITETENCESETFETETETVQEETTEVLETEEILANEESQQPEETINHTMKISVEESLDSQGNYLYLRLTGDGVLDLMQNKDKFDKLEIFVKEPSKDGTGTELGLNGRTIRYISSKEALVQLEKDAWTNTSVAVKIREVIETPVVDDGETGDTTDTPQVIKSYKVIAENTKLDISSGILYAFYNPVNNKLSMAVTSDLKNKPVTIVNADESEKYDFTTDGNANVGSVTSNGEIVKLGVNAEYWVKLGNDTDVIKAKINYGTFADRMALQRKPKTVKVFRPYEFKEILEYTVSEDETLKYENGVNYYVFSERLLNDGAVRPKDEVYNVEFWIGNNKLGNLENITFSELKWDGTYQIKTKQGEIVDKEQTLTMYYGNEKYNTATLTIENAKAIPKFLYSSPNIVSVDIQESDTENKKYTALISATSTGTTKVSIKIGEVIEEFTVEVKPARKIDSLEFIDYKDNDIIIEGIGKRATFDIKINPYIAIGSGEIIEVISSDENIVQIDKVEDWSSGEGSEASGGKRISLKAVAIGETKVNITVKDSVQSNSLSVNVKVTLTSFSDSEKLVLKKNVGTLYAITNITGDTLQDIELPKGWEWEKPDTEIKIDKNIPVQYHEAKYTQESYMPFTALLPVAITEISGFEIIGDNRLTRQHTGKYRINLLFNGYQVALDKNKTFADLVKSVVKCTWSADNMLVLTSTDGWEIEAVAQDTPGTTEGVIYATVSIGNDVFNELCSVTVVDDHITEITITPTPSLRDPVPFKYDNIENVAYVDEGNLSRVTNRISLVVTAKMEEKDVTIEEGMFNWSVNDKTLADIYEMDDGTIQLTILKKGTIIVTATAKDVGCKTIDFPIEVRDFSPLVETKTFVINKYSETGLELPVYAVEGNMITKINIADENFRVDYVNGKYILSIRNKEIFVNKTTIKTKMSVRTQMVSNIEEDVNIIVDTEKPKIKFKQKTAPNVFYSDADIYKDAEAVVTVNTLYNVIDIKDTAQKSVGFVVKDYDAVKKQLILEPKGLTSANVDEFKNKNSAICKVEVAVTYEGYGTINEIVSISPKVVKPKYKIKEITTLGTETKNETYIYSSSRDIEETLPITATAYSITDRVTAQKSGNRILIEYNGTKSKNYKIALSDENWTSTLILSGKLTIANQMATQLEAGSIFLNMAHNITDNGVVALGVTAKNNITDVTDVEFEAVDRKTKELIKSGYLDVTFDSYTQKLRVGINKKISLDVKPGTYKIEVTGFLGYGSAKVRMKKAKLNIVLVNPAKKPDVKFTKKGSINLADRERTSIIYTPKVSNMTANITRVETTGEYALYFESELTDDGKIKVQAVSDIPMNAGVSYSLGLKMSFNNKTDVIKTVKIKPVNKLPKIKANVTKGKIYKVSGNDIKWTLRNDSDYGEIESITIVDNKVSKNFVFECDKNNNLSIKMKPDAKRIIKKGTYTISYQVKVKDAASNAKPIILKMKVIIK